MGIESGGGNEPSQQEQAEESVLDAHHGPIVRRAGRSVRALPKDP
jgi:hypothetical protein